MKSLFTRLLTLLLAISLVADPSYAVAYPAQTGAQTLSNHSFLESAMSLFPPSWTRRGAFRLMSVPFLTFIASSMADTPAVGLASAALTPEGVNVLRRMAARIRWRSAYTVFNANKLRSDEDAPAPQSVGGHQATPASLVEVITVLETIRRPGDVVVMVPHAAPAWYGFLVSLIEDVPLLQRYRTKILPAYPSHRTPSLGFANPVIPTGSLGKGPVAGIGLAAALQYARDHKMRDDAPNVWIVIGDGEMGEETFVGALRYIKQFGLTNVKILLNFNLQRLDPVVTDGEATRFERMFENEELVTDELKYSAQTEALFRVSGGTEFEALLDSLTEQEWRAMLRKSEDEMRQILIDIAPVRHKDVVTAFLRNLPSGVLQDVFLTPGGHSIPLLHERLVEMRDTPRPMASVIWTVKGKGLPGLDGVLLNHSRHLDQSRIDKLREDSGLLPGDEWADFPKGSSEHQLFNRLRAERKDYAAKDRARLGDIRARLKELAAALPNQLEVSAQPNDGTLAAFGRVFQKLAKTPAGRHLVAMAGDVFHSMTFDGWILAPETKGLWGPTSTPSRVPEERTPTDYKGPSPEGQSLAFSNSEQTVALTAAAFGKQEELIPIMGMYEEFIPLAAEMLRYVDYFDARLFLVSLVTSPAEGAQHQSVLGPPFFMEYENGVLYDPAFPIEVNWMMMAALKSMLSEPRRGRLVNLRVAKDPILPQSRMYELLRMQQEYAGLSDEEINEKLRPRSLGGAYTILDYSIVKSGQFHLDGIIFATGKVLDQAIQASEAMFERGIYTKVIYVTSPSELKKDQEFAQAMRNEGQQVISRLEQLIPPGERYVPMITVTDARPSVLGWIGSALGSKVRSLGSRTYASSMVRLAMLRHEGIDAASIARALIANRAGPIGTATGGLLGSLFAALYDWLQKSIPLPETLSLPEASRLYLSQQLGVELTPEQVHKTADNPTALRHLFSSGSENVLWVAPSVFNKYAQEPADNARVMRAPSSVPELLVKLKTAKHLPHALVLNMDDFANEMPSLEELFRLTHDREIVVVFAVPASSVESRSLELLTLMSVVVNKVPKYQEYVALLVEPGALVTFNTMLAAEYLESAEDPKAEPLAVTRNEIFLGWAPVAETAFFQGLLVGVPTMLVYDIYGLFAALGVGVALTVYSALLYAGDLTHPFIYHGTDKGPAVKAERATDEDQRILTRRGLEYGAAMTVSVLVLGVFGYAWAGVIVGFFAAALFHMIDNLTAMNMRGGVIGTATGGPQRKADPDPQAFSFLVSEVSDFVKEVPQHEPDIHTYLAQFIERLSGSLDRTREELRPGHPSSNPTIPQPYADLIDEVETLINDVQEPEWAAAAQKGETYLLAIQYATEMAPILQTIREFEKQQKTTRKSSAGRTTTLRSIALPVAATFSGATSVMAGGLETLWVEATSAIINIVYGGAYAMLILSVTAAVSQFSARIYIPGRVKGFWVTAGLVGLLLLLFGSNTVSAAWASMPIVLVVDKLDLLLERSQRDSDPAKHPAQIISDVLGAITLVSIPPIPSTTFYGAEPLTVDQKLKALDGWRSTIYAYLNKNDPHTPAESINERWEKVVKVVLSAYGYSGADVKTIVRVLRNEPSALWLKVGRKSYSIRLLRALRWYTGDPNAQVPLEVLSKLAEKVKVTYSESQASPRASLLATAA